MSLRADALTIWRAAVDAVMPRPLVAAAVRALDLPPAGRVIVVGAGKAGAEMAAGVEEAFLLTSPLEGDVGETQSSRVGGSSATTPHPPSAPQTPTSPSRGEVKSRLSGLVNVPEGCSAPLRHIRLHPARPAGSNFPTPAGVAGAEEMLRHLVSAEPGDTALCLLSGGGSALLPCPADGVSLESKLEITKLLHGSGATIHEMNCVRKHLSRVKGGRLTEAFGGQQLISLIISDVVGDPLDVIASGPTAPDPTTFADAKAVLDRYGLWTKCASDVTLHIQKGCDGLIPDTPKVLPTNVRNVVIGTNAVALAAARLTAGWLGYGVLDLGPFIEGETRQIAAAMAGIVRNIRERKEPLPPPACILVGGETTVTLGENPGKGGRNQEFALAVLERLGADGMRDVAVLSGGTDGEDGPTDAAGAVADGETWAKATTAGLSAPDHLVRHDAYPFFDAVGGLLRTGPTGTNVADVRVVLVR